MKRKTVQVAAIREQVSKYAEFTNKRKDMDADQKKDAIRKYEERVAKTQANATAQ